MTFEKLVELAEANQTSNLPWLIDLDPTNEKIGTLGSIPRDEGGWWYVVGYDPSGVVRRQAIANDMLEKMLGNSPK